MLKVILSPLMLTATVILFTLKIGLIIIKETVFIVSVPLIMAMERIGMLFNVLFSIALVGMIAGALLGDIDAECFIMVLFGVGIIELICFKLEDIEFFIESSLESASDFCSELICSVWSF